MGKVFTFIALVLLGSSGLKAQEDTAQLMLDSAALFYAEGEFSAALDLFQKVNATGESADLYVNMGNCAYRLNDVASTVLYYERALRLSPADSEALAYLNAAKKEINDGLPDAEKSNLGRSFSAFLYAHAPSFWRNLTVLLLAVAFGLLVWQLFLSGRIKKWAKALGVAALLFGLATLFISWMHHDYQHTRSEGVIFAQIVKVRKEANLMSDDVTVLKAGSKVNIEERENNWVRISLNNGTTGWIAEKDIEVI